MLKARQVCCFLLGCVCIVAMWGCGANDGRQGASGAVTLDGKPLPSGIISFRPTEGTNAGTAGSGIKDGRYTIIAKKGLKPGEYKVTVQAFEETGRMVEDPQFGKVKETARIVFKEAGTLKATVTDGGENQFNFDLTKKQR